MPAEIPIPTSERADIPVLLNARPDPNTQPLTGDGLGTSSHVRGGTGEGIGASNHLGIGQRAKELTEALQMPPRSRLYSLEPAGMGTPLVECATSYIARLAYAHMVTVRVLIESEISERLSPYRSDDRKAPTWLCLARAYAVNGSQDLARDLVSVLEQLTLRTDLSALTMLPWSEVLSTQGLLRRTRTWCPACLETWRRAGQVVYEPLLWQLQAVTVCPVHRRVLRSCCPACKGTLPMLASRTLPGRCSKCQTWLGINQAQLREVNQDGVTEWELWVATGLGEMLATAPRREQWPKGTRLRNTLAPHPDGDQVSTSTNAKSLGWHKRKLLNFYAGRCVLEMKTLLHICFEQNTYPVRFLSEAEDISEHPPVWAQAIHHQGELQIGPDVGGTRATGHRPVPVEQLRKALTGILYENTDEPLSLTKAARQLSYDRRQLYRAFPELSKAIAQRYVVHSKARRAAVLDSVEEEVRQMTRRCYGEGVAPTRRKVGSLLKKPGCMRMPMARQAWAETCRELGIEP